MDQRSDSLGTTAPADGSGRRVVVGVDGSDGSGTALRWALAAAARRGAELEVVAVYPVGLPWRWDPAIDAPHVEAVRRDVEERARAFGSEVRAGISGVDAVPVQVVTAPGHAATVLVERSEGADLLVVGSRGRGIARSALLGSVALHCATDAHCPVVVVHPGRSDREETRPVVAGVDDCPDAAAVVLAAMEEAAGLGADLEVVAAYGTGDHWSAEIGSAAEVGQVREVVRQRLDELVQQVRTGPAARLGDRLPVVEALAVEGSPYDVLIGESDGARLLVVGRRGHGGVRSLLMGSVALHAVVSARVPVMVVHPAAVPAAGPAKALQDAAG
jgi:nucleotide-binding universal stress UspA family protein